MVALMPKYSALSGDNIDETRIEFGFWLFSLALFIIIATMPLQFIKVLGLGRVHPNRQALSYSGFWPPSV
jgi:hypothetical protein